MAVLKGSRRARSPTCSLKAKAGGRGGGGGGVSPQLDCKSRHLLRRTCMHTGCLLAAPPYLGCVNMWHFLHCNVRLFFAHQVMFSCT
eukprot:363235-Chlamydomonas_euryale.AAC.6